MTVLSSSPELAEVVDEAADLGVGVVEECGEGLLEAAGEDLLVVGQVVPRVDAGVAGGELGVGGGDAELDLAFEPALAHDVPALVVLPAVLGEVLLGRLVGRVGRPERARRGRTACRGAPTWCRG